MQQYGYIIKNGEHLTKKVENVGVSSVSFPQRLDKSFINSLLADVAQRQQFGVMHHNLNLTTRGPKFTYFDHRDQLEFPSILKKYILVFLTINNIMTKYNNVIN